VGPGAGVCSVDSGSGSGSGAEAGQLPGFPSDLDAWNLEVCFPSLQGYLGIHCGLGITVPHPTPSLGTSGARELLPGPSATETHWGCQVLSAKIASGVNSLASHSRPLTSSLWERQGRARPPHSTGVL
jgi:hypothetical protein